jgi:UTP--glucose-1-phosphate uridylyltransferase
LYLSDKLSQKLQQRNEEIPDCGRTFDCGSRLGFLSANIALALDRGDLAPGLKEELRRLGFAGKGS